jgi:hypothetical protein
MQGQGMINRRNRIVIIAISVGFCQNQIGCRCSASLFAVRVKTMDSLGRLTITVDSVPDRRRAYTLLRYLFSSSLPAKT